MPGRLFLTTPLAEIASWMGANAAGLNDPPRWNMSPGEDITVCTPERQLAHMRWGMIPVGRVNARGRPVMETIINARSETVFDKSAFDGVGRALIPVDGWYEWTGKARRKTPWRIRRKDGAPLAFAAITDVWKAPGGIEVPQVAAVTCLPSDDVVAVHHRMGVILEPSHFEDWLSGDVEIAARLMQPLAAGTLSVEPADDVDWSKP